MAVQARSGALQRAIVVGTILQLAMVASGHWIAAIAALFALLGMAISLFAGWLSTFQGNSRGAAGARDGAIAGGACALIGIVVSYLLGDVTASIIVFGTLSSAATGAIGGWAGGTMGGRERVVA